MIKKNRILTVILLSLFGCFITSLHCTKSYALAQVPTLRFGLGYSPLKFTAGQLTQQPGSTSGSNNTESTQALGSMVTLNPMFLWDVPAVRSRIGVQFLADIGSQYSFLATSGVGIVALFYPLGLSSSREMKDDNSEIRKSRVSPYFQVALTPTVFTITYPSTPATATTAEMQGAHFSALIVETSLGIGIDYPINQSIVAFFGLHTRFAAFNDQESSVGRITYSGPEALFGIMTNFY